MKGMVMNAKTLVPVIALLVSAGIVSAEMRTWTNIKGGTIEAEFIELKHSKVFLRTPDGQTRNIPKSKLIEEDQRLVDELSNPAIQNSASAKVQTEASDAIYELFGKRLYNAQDKKVSTDTLAGKTIGIYFSAHWCPPCQAFTPKLVEFHKKITANGQPFEIVFVSSDRDKRSMYDYMEEMEMPWLALPFGDGHKDELSEKYGIQGIPALVIVDQTGELITLNGRDDVSSKGKDAFEDWTR